MAVYLLSLLLRVGFVIGSNYRHDKWSDHERESEIRAKQPIYNTPINSQEQLHHLPRLFKPGTEQSAFLQKIEEDLPKVVMAFLHTGDPSTLRHANCSRRYELSGLRGPAYTSSYSSLRSVLDAVAQAANFLNVILQANRSRLHSLQGDSEWYWALVRSILEGDHKIQRVVLTFNKDLPLPGHHIFLQATRTESGIVLQDLSSTAHHRLRNKTVETEWFSEIRDRRKHHLHRRVLSQEVKSPDVSLRGDSYVLDKTEIKWSAPFLECDKGTFIPQWLLTLSAGFYGLKQNQVPEFRGVVRVDVSLQDVDIDQCSSSGWFAGTHRCNSTSMECVSRPGHGFVLDKYRCECKEGFYHPSRVTTSSFKRKAERVESSGRDSWEGSSHCLPCREGCAYCKDDTPCHTHADGPLRVAAVVFQGLCMLADFFSMVVIYRFRGNKCIRASGLVLLEAILFGALLLYFPVLILYFQPSTFRCILLRWVRLLGFAIVYGTVTLKLYRVLKVFLSRTAQRIPFMTSWRVLHLLAVILLVVCWFLVAWTLAICQNLERHVPLIDVGLTAEGLQFSMCLLDRWDYMMAIAELLFLLWGVYLCYAVRTVPSAFHEPRYMAVAVHNELVISAVFHVVRFTAASGLHPDWTLMLWFAHTHLTVTVTIGLLLIPKFLFAGTPTRDDIATEAYEDELDMGRSGSYLNSSITSAWSEHSLDPEDIREELKKLYAQLEVYKRKKMLANNPHLQKKRSSKKGLGRSLMRRITEIPESVSRQCSREDKELGDHGSNRNSICTLRKNPFEPSHSTKPKEDSLKNKVFSLKKSHSSYDHVRNQSEDSNSSATDKMEVSNENSLLESLMGKKLVKKKSAEKIEAESTESVPLVCKSASAHNLTADKKPLHPRTSMLQKSLSVIASAREKTLGLAGKAQNVEENNKKNHQKSREANTHPDMEEKLPEDSIAMTPSQYVENKQLTSKTGIIKPQVSGGQSSMSGEMWKNKDLYDLSEVCPWEVEDLTMPSESKMQKHVSIAPEETTSVHGSGTRGKTKQKLRVMDEPLSNSRHSGQIVDEGELCFQDPEGESWCLGDGTKPPTTGHSIPAHSAGESNKADICPWDFEELPVKQVTGVKSSEKDRGKGDTLVEGTGGGLHQDRPKSKPTTRVDICPWDYDCPTSSNSERGSSLAQLSKLKDSVSKKRATSSSKMAEMEKEKPKEKNNEKGRQKMRESTEKWPSQSKIEEVCAWDVESPTETLPGDTPKSSSKLGIGQNKQADICPWDFEDESDNKEQNRNPSAAKQISPNFKGGDSGKARLADVCPWDFDEPTSGKNA
uniref:G protein-coupled receptor 158 n=1 Tax=Paramormyrops kingsleyae TaxID=1676925 RepID=A0A3B3SG73_9TELE|nr:probable G-protein coupled receptor 158 [Paramormyrops kingsleyae]